MSIFQLLNGNNYVVFNRDIAHEIGLNETLVLSEILDKYSYFKTENKLIEAPGQEGLWFYVKSEIIFQRTTLTEKQQRPCIEKLISLGFLKKTSFGLPCQRYFQVCEEALEVFIISKIKSTRSDKMSTPDISKGKDSPIHKRLIEETNREREGTSPPASPPPATLSFFQRGNVKIREDKLKELLDKYGELQINDYIERLEDYSETNPKKFKTYSCHAAVIRTWLKRDKAPQIKTPEDKTANHPTPEAQRLVSKIEANYKWVCHQYEKNLALQAKVKIVIFRNYVDFPDLPEGKIYYDSEGFKERFENNLRKINV